MPNDPSYTCAHCGQRFAGPAAYDRHRLPALPRGTKVCVYPGLLGLRLNLDGRWEVPPARS